VRHACERLARHRGMSRRFIFNHADIAAGTPGVILGLLEDVRVFYDGKVHSWCSERYGLCIIYLLPIAHMTWRE